MGEISYEFASYFIRWNIDEHLALYGRVGIGGAEIGLIGTLGVSLTLF